MSADSAGRAWEWADDDGDVVVEEQPPVAIYINPKGAIVIRQRAENRDDDDPFLWFAPQHALAIAKAILEAAGLDAADIADLTLETAQVATKPMASTSAARQRRYRDRKKKEPALFDSDERNVTEGESVTSRDGTKT